MLQYKCVKCRKDHTKNQWKLKEFAYTDCFCNTNSNKFDLMVPKGVYPCVYHMQKLIDDWLWQK